MISELPVELRSKIFTFMSHPCADMVGRYHAKAKACDDVECYAKRKLLHERTVRADVETKGYWSFSLNLCQTCKVKLKREWKELRQTLAPFSERCQEREVRTWFYENYRLPRNTLELFESMFEDDVDSDFEEEEEN
jgi:endogenous inhibitor of DNA gyrase (YacG/DUF329 family)